ncbi:MAG: DUF2974 domain-containing protein [Clostridiales bacterium]|nr:DUF2974 domain-containing protein [Clostridiales bacterium]
MNEALINKSTVLELLTYLIADNNEPIREGTPLQEVFEDLDAKSDNRQYIDLIRTAIDQDPSIGKMKILRTSIDAGFDSPMSAVCFKDDNAVYVQYRGTPKGGWVQNPISFGVDLEGAMAPDGISSQIQADGLTFFDECVKAYAGHGYTGELIVGGHSQGGNVAEYVTMMSEYSSLIDLCLSLDGPNHSDDLYNHILKRYGIEHFNAAREKILAINGNNDYVNMLGQREFAAKKNTYYVETIGNDGFVGWHDMACMIDPNTGRLYSRFDNKGKRVEQGPVALMMVEIVGMINKLPKKYRDDTAKTIMGFLEIVMGSKDWDDLKKIGLEADNWYAFLFSDEAMGFQQMGFFAILWTLVTRPKLAFDLIAEAVPEDIRAIIEYTFNDASIAEIGILIGVTVAFGLAVLAAVYIAKPIIIIVSAIKKIVFFVTHVEEFLKAMKALLEAVFRVLGDVWDIVVDIFHAIKEGLQKVAEWIKDAFNHGDDYVKDHFVIKADTLALRDYAVSVGRVNTDIKELDRMMNSLYSEVRIIDQLSVAKANILTGSSLTLGRIRNYLNDTADRLEAAENKAHNMMGG